MEGLASATGTRTFSTFHPSATLWGRKSKPRMTRIRAATRDRGKNRKPLQRGRNLSIETIQTVQALKRAYRQLHPHLHHESINTVHLDSSTSLDYVFRSKFNRLLKLDMMAVLLELIRQNHCLLALKVFEAIRKEYWYKPRVSLYHDMITLMVTNGFMEQVQLLHVYLTSETNLEPKTEEFNALFTTLLSFNLPVLVMDCYDLMRKVGCEPDRSTFKILINGLDSVGERAASGIVRLDAEKCYGEGLEFLEEEDE